MNIPEDLTRAQRAVFTSAFALAAGAAPVTGVVPGGAVAIAALLGVDDCNVYRALPSLLARRLMRRTGATRASRLVVVELGAVAHQVRGGGATRPSGGKFSAGSDAAALRARIGGYERAMREVQAQRDAAKVEAEQLRRGRRLAADPALVALLADLDHATDCADPSCTRCDEIGRKVEAARAEYATEGEIVDQIARAGAIEVAGAELLAALTDRGLGAMQRRASAAQAFARAMSGGELQGRP